MRTIKILFFMSTLVVCFNLHGTAHAEKISPTLKQVLISGKGFDARIEIHADKPLTYTYYRMPGLLKVVIDLALVDPGQVMPLITSSGLISKVTIEKKDITTFSLTRVLITLDTDADFSVHSDAGDKSRLSINFRPKPTATAHAPVKPEPAAEVAINGLKSPTLVPASLKLTATPLAIVASNKKNSESPDALTGSSTKPAVTEKTVIVAVPQQHKVISPRPILQPVVPQGYSSKLITSVKAARKNLIIKADARMDDYKAFTLKNPGRLVIDVPMARTHQVAKEIPMNRFGVTRARLGNYPDKIRLVFDAKGDVFPPYRIDRNNQGLAIAFTGKGAK